MKLTRVVGPAVIVALAAKRSRESLSHRSQNGALRALTPRVTITLIVQHKFSSRRSHRGGALRGSDEGPYSSDSGAQRRAHGRAHVDQPVFFCGDDLPKLGI